MRLAVVLLLSLTASAFSQTGADAQVVGKWIYVTKSLKVDAFPAVKAKGRSHVEKMKQGLAVMLSRVTVTFKPNHTMAATDSYRERTSTGRWSLQGAKVKLVMDGQKQPSPLLTLESAGRKIDCVYKYPGFGTAHVQLVKM